MSQQLFQTHHSQTPQIQSTYDSPHKPLSPSYAPQDFPTQPPNPIQILPNNLQQQTSHHTQSPETLTQIKSDFHSQSQITQIKTPTTPLSNPAPINLAAPLLPATPASNTGEILPDVLNKLASAHLTSSWKPDTFTALSSYPTPDMWLEKFEAYATFNYWDDNKKASAFPLLLSGPAELWFSQLLPEHKESYSTMKQKFLEYFKNISPIWVREQALDTTQQGTNQSVDAYIAEIKWKFATLSKSPGEQLSAFVRGLRSDIKAFVIAQSPTTLAQAEEKARLAEVVSNLSATKTPQVVPNKEQPPPIDSRPPAAAAERNSYSSNNQSPQPNTNQQDDCQICGSWEHTALRCPTYRASTYQNRASVMTPDPPVENEPHPQTYQNRAADSTPQCQICGKWNHTAQTCYRRYQGANPPNERPRAGYWQRPRRFPRVNNNRPTNFQNSQQPNNTRNRQNNTRTPPRNDKPDLDNTPTNNNNHPNGKGHPN
jgi:hypothetical protein